MNVKRLLSTGARSWKTTTLGIIASIMILLSSVQAVLDDDPETCASAEDVVAALAILGIGFAAKDSDKSSEDVGIK